MSSGNDKLVIRRTSTTEMPLTNSGENRLEVIQSIIAYTACSATMLLINKMVMHAIPLPSMVSVAQFAASCAAVVFVQAIGKTEIENFRQEELIKYVIYVSAFVAGLWCNMKSLQLANVETVIVFRACTPLAQSFLDYFFLGRALPDARSVIALGGVAFGAYLYVLSDSEFQARMTYGKLMSDAMKYSLSSTVLYNNAMAIPPMIVLGFLTGEFDKVGDLTFTAHSLLMLVLSCAVGTGISYSGWWCRSHTTAAVYTTLGVLCKFATVLLNLLVWDKHANPAGIVALLICLVSGTMYQEAPSRKKPNLL